MSLQNLDLAISLGPITADVAAGTGGVWGYTVPGSSSQEYQVVEAKLYPDAAITANGTNFSTYTLVNENGTQTICTRAYSSGNSVAKTPETLAIATHRIRGGDVLTWNKVESGTGLAGRPRVNFVLRRVTG